MENDGFVPGMLFGGLLIGVIVWFVTATTYDGSYEVDGLGRGTHELRIESLEYKDNDTIKNYKIYKRTN